MGLADEIDEKLSTYGMPKMITLLENKRVHYSFRPLNHKPLVKQAW